MNYVGGAVVGMVAMLGLMSGCTYKTTVELIVPPVEPAAVASPETPANRDDAERGAEDVGQGVDGEEGLDLATRRTAAPARKELVPIRRPRPLPEPYAQLGVPAEGTAESDVSRCVPEFAPGP